MAKAAKLYPDGAVPLNVGGAVLGYTKPRAEQLRRARAPIHRIRAYRRWNALRRLVSYRRRWALDLGPPIGWAQIIANVLAASEYPATLERVSWFCDQIGLPRIEEHIVAGAVRDPEIARRVASTYVILPAGTAGALLQVSSVEREELGMKTIDAVDESAQDRRRRLARERQRRRRAL